MYAEGLIDHMEMFMVLPFVTDTKPKLDNIRSKAEERYLPVFEKVCCNNSLFKNINHS